MNHFKRLALMPRFARRSPSFATRVAITNPDGQAFTYQQLNDAAQGIALSILRNSGKGNVIAVDDQVLEPTTISFLCEPGFNYVATQWAIWRLGCIAVPLCTAHPVNELMYVVNDAQSSLLIADSSRRSTVDEMLGLLSSSVASADSNHSTISSAPANPASPSAFHPGLASPLFVDSANPGKVLESQALDDDALYELSLSADSEQEDHVEDRGSMLIYTSGTTGNPKGVLTMRSGIDAQVSDLVSSWEWTQDDRILHFLPLHHVHGVVNKLCCPLAVGAHVEFMEKFDPVKVFQRIADDTKPEITVLMGVPTIYNKLIAAFDAQDANTQQAWSAACSKLRLMVSGSAPLPTTVFYRWEEMMNGHRLLERYGMTEFGMGLSNPLRPMEKRLAGYVGQPLPSVQVKLVDEDTGETVPPGVGGTGLLFVRGANVFKEYWGRPEATAEEFDEDGWFRTGDIAEYDAKEDSYMIRGRLSADIIKTGGYKLSALRIESVLLNVPGVSEVAVVGVDDDEYGQRVVALVVSGDAGDDEALRASMIDYAMEHLPKYSVPREIRFMEAIPRNAMGKVNKKQLVKELFP